MTQIEQLVEIAAEQHGLLRVADAASVGVASAVVRRLAHEGRLERVSHGVYRVVALPTDRLTPYLEASLWANGLGVISHASAIEMLELADVAPRRIHITVPAAYNPRKVGGAHYRVHRLELEQAEVTTHEGVPVVDAAVAIGQSIDDGEDPEQLRLAVRTAGDRGLLTRSETSGLLARLRR
jgi:predicted transcriptional regulator of viral defense system